VARLFERVKDELMNAIETNQLTRAFGSLVAVDDLTLAIPEGTVFGFLGPNGAGKTTTVRLLSALIAPTRGSATVAGHRLGEHNEAIRQAVGILTETPGLYDRLSAWQNLLFFAQMYDLPASRARSTVEQYLRLLDLWERRNDKVGGFSKGMRQKLAIARALLHEPQVIFLDEPTAGLDPEAARVVRDFIKALRAEGRTIFLTTHNLPEADELCDLIGVFRMQLLRLGTPAQLRAGMFGSGTQVHVVGDAARWLETVRTLSVSLAHPDEQNPALVRALVEAGAPIRALEPTSHSLEEVYLELVESERKAAAVATK
jgi:ABC-2 type transport system ATP-binding protein